MQANQVMTTNLVTITPDKDLTYAARLMREHHVGFLVVTNQAHHGHPVGIITDRDIVIEVVAVGIDPSTIKTADVMSTKVMIAVENEDILSITSKMRSMGIRRAPVISTWGKLVGVITFDDLLSLANSLLNDMTGSIINQIAIEKRLRGHS